jgi:hypothetical protein
LDPVGIGGVELPGVSPTNHWDWWSQHSATQSISNWNSWQTNCTHNQAWWTNTGRTTDGNYRAAKINESQTSA